MKHLMSACTGLQSLVYKKFEVPSSEDLTGARVDLLWNMSLLLKSPRPLWSGMMQSIYQDSHPGIASVLFLPMINLDPGNLFCIYSTL